jgi:hypothetical protein
LLGQRHGISRLCILRRSGLPEHGQRTLLHVFRVSLLGSDGWLDGPTSASLRIVWPFVCHTSLRAVRLLQERVQHGTDSYYLHATGCDVEPMAIFSLDETFQAVPTEVACGNLPGELDGVGVVQKQIGPLEAVVPFGITHRASWTEQQLRFICKSLSVEVKVLPGDKGVTKRALLVALCSKCFPAEDADSCAQLVSDMLSPILKGTSADDPELKAVLECLDPADKSFFEDLEADGRYCLRIKSLAVDPGAVSETDAPGFAGGLRVGIRKYPWVPARSKLDRKS